MKKQALESITSAYETISTNTVDRILIDEEYVQRKRKKNSDIALYKSSREDNNFPYFDALNIHSFTILR